MAVPRGPAPAAAPAGVTTRPAEAASEHNGHPIRVTESYAYPKQKVGIWSGRAFDEAKQHEWKVVQREQVANPAPLGLFAFGYTTALLQGFNTGLTEPGTNNIVYGYAVFYGGLAQLLAGMWEFKRQNTFGAAAFSSYGAFWMGFALFQILAIVVPGYEIPPQGDKMFLSLWGILTFIFSIGTLCLNFALWLLFISLSILFFILAGAVGPDLVNRAAAGWFGLFVAGIAWYIAAADIINENFGRTVLPIGKWNVGVPMFKAFKAVMGKIPVVGWVYVRSCNREDRLAGYATDSSSEVEKKYDDNDVEAGSRSRHLVNDSAVYPHAYQLHDVEHTVPGGFEGDAVRRQASGRDVGSGIGPY